jgi:hypothetical protein
LALPAIPVRTLKKLAIGLVNLVIFFFLIRWASQNIKWELLLDHLYDTPLFAVAPLVILNTLALMIHGLRLSVLLPGSFNVSVQIVNLSAGFNIILPFRLGDVARIYFAKRSFPITVSKLLATGLIEKFFDLLALGLLIVIVLLFSNDKFVGTNIAFGLFCVILSAYAALLLFRHLSHNAETWFGNMIKVQRLIATLREDTKVHDITEVSILTLAIWILNVAVVYVGFAGFLPDLQVNIKDAVFILIITALAIAIPGTPAGLGVYEAGIVAYLTHAYNIEAESALASAIVFHGAMVVPQLVLTAIGLFKLWIAKTTALPSG